MTETETAEALSLADGALSFCWDGLCLHSARPTATVLLGPEEQPHILTPSGEPLRCAWSRSTPAGQVRGQSMRWELAPGFTFTWTVGAFERRPGLVMSARLCNQTPDPVRLRSIVLSTQARRASRSWRPRDLR